MVGRQAKILSNADIVKVLNSVCEGPEKLRDRVIVLLAVRAGLRACEIANLTWDMVLHANGRVGDYLEIRNSIAKRKRGRRVPIHPQLRSALRGLWARQVPKSNGVPVVKSRRGGHLRPNSIVNWFIGICRAAGLEGCSSHSGRRTFITLAARCAHQTGATLRDVQILAGHASIETTQRYIDGCSDAQRRLVTQTSK